MVLGIDLTDDYIAVCAQEEQTASVFPAVVCREKREDLWYIGEEAYRVALAGQGVMTDRLLKLLSRNGTSTVYHRVYTASELLGKLFYKVIETRLRTSDFSVIDKVCLCVHTPDAALMDLAAESLSFCGIGREKITVITHEEAFVQYILSRDREFYSSMVALFDLTGEKLSYYEFMMVRGVSRRACVAEGEDLEEAFHTDILKKEAGRDLADKIMTDVAKKRMEGRIFSSVFLTGTGFDRTDWAPSFLDFVCRKRRVIQESGLFAIGARILAEKQAKGEENPRDGVLIFCNDRLSSEISVSVSIRERESGLVLASAGDRWHDLKVHVELIPKDQKTMDFTIEPFDRRKQKRLFRVDLSALPIREDRATRLSVDLGFDRADRALLSVRDMGFGELFAPSGQTVEEEILL